MLMPKFQECHSYKNSASFEANLFRKIYLLHNLSDNYFYVLQTFNFYLNSYPSSVSFTTEYFKDDNSS